MREEGKQLKNEECCLSKEAVVEKYYNMVYKLALSQTKDRTNTDDVVQEVFLRYIRGDTAFESD